ncbi:cell division protein ZapA [Rhodoblastus acidophilus]|uniref:cell division protein ZapA n=1 Tax=Rhodoblastus acidophilus TaxID=1074 RepID=UPI0022257952|nr:cell division protein ZapA [Rhodoblastus acidophilus]MCW2282361.1 cell division protein ZapA [Rhodoblastus acidophilus]MCW2331234.1 cell division protein ZapA [Rhodoblastus acidophilus]
MAQAVVTIAGRAYRMGCEEGEQAHIEELARLLDARIADLRGVFGEIGEQRIVVMAALTLSDELFAAKKQLAETQAELETARLRQQEVSDWAAKALDKATAKVTAATKALNET